MGSSSGAGEGEAAGIAVKGLTIPDQRAAVMPILAEVEIAETEGGDVYINSKDVRCRHTGGRSEIIVYPTRNTTLYLFT